MSQDDDATIERVARAICEATSGPFEMLDDVGRDALRCEARAAITAYLSAMPQRELLAEALEARLAALEEAAVIAETWFDHHRPQQPKKSRFDIYDIEHWAKSATRLVAEDIRARAAADKIRAALTQEPQP
jgi:hypothetical protein